jgi:MFS superfamily sulfate permease-like transporter
MADTRETARHFLSIAGWLPRYESAWLRFDLVAGVTLAAYAVPQSLAYPGLAGLPAQMGLYCYLFAGWATLSSDRRVTWPLARRPPSHCSWELP